METKEKGSEISVLVQGPMIEGGWNIQDCVGSVERLLPQAEIVISTWENPDTKGLQGDKIVLVEDPKEVTVNLLGNINRQIAGRLAGLKVCSRKYTLVMRSDSELVNLNFLDAFRKGYERGRYDSYRFFEERVVCCSGGRMENALYHLCDWFFFGLTKDLLSLYEIPMFDPTNMENERLPKYHTPHEYLTIHFIEKFLKLDYDYAKLHRKEEVKRWQQILCENFITQGFYKNYGIINRKQPYLDNQIQNDTKLFPGIRHLMLNFEKEDWICLYNLLYGKKEKVSQRISWRIARRVNAIYRKIRR